MGIVVDKGTVGVSEIEETAETETIVVVVETVTEIGAEEEGAAETSILDLLGTHDHLPHIDTL